MQQCCNTARGTTIDKTISLPAMIKQVRSNFRKQEEFIRKSVAVDIRAIKKLNDGTLTGKDFKKVLTYYGLAVPAVPGEGYCLLRGKEMSRPGSERVKEQLICDMEKPANRLKLFRYYLENIYFPGRKVLF